MNGSEGGNRGCSFRSCSILSSGTEPSLCDFVMSKQHCRLIRVLSGFEETLCNVTCFRKALAYREMAVICDQITRPLDFLARDQLALVTHKNIITSFMISFIFFPIKRLIVIGQPTLLKLRSLSSSAQQRTRLFRERGFGSYNSHVRFTLVG